jgi:hypothetical protein
MARSARAAASTTSGPDQPAFWFGFEVTRAKLVLARVVVFALLAFDALLQVRHAPRYGAGGFNLGQLAIFDAFGPTRTSFAIAELVLAYVFTLVACGVAVRQLLPIATAVYGWLYFGSQLDSFQHHYLVWLVLLLACFVPWTGAPNAAPGTRVRSWAVRLILVQLALVYAWAAVSKLSGAWLDGEALARVVGGRLRSTIDATIGMAWAARLTLAIEVALAATIWNVRTWWLATILGIGLHVAILVSGLEIGLFAWLMLGLYVLVIPDRAWVAVAESTAVQRVCSAGAGLARGLRRPLVSVPLAVAVTIVVAISCRLPEAALLAPILGAVASVATACFARNRVAAIALAHAVALAGWAVVDRTTEVAADYTRYWAGTARRLGDLRTAASEYRALLDLEPDNASAHYQLARVLAATGADDAAFAELHATERLEPSRARAFVAEARWLAARGRHDAAVTAVRAALTADPRDPAARALLEQLDDRSTAPGQAPPRGSASDHGASDPGASDHRDTDDEEREPR